MPDRDEALNLLKQYLKDKKNIYHSLESEIIMKALAQKLGEDESQWGIAGLLHDLDWELTQEDFANHGLKAKKILEQNNYSPEIVHAVAAHNGENNGIFRESRLDYAVICAETITGLIYAATLVRPDKKIANLEVKSLKKKFKDKSFAANCSREAIKECENLGLDLNEFFELSIKAMAKISDKIGLN